MDRPFRIIDQNRSIEEQQSRKRQGIDWALCVLCQESTDEALRDPSQNKRSKKDEGYASLGRNLKAFHGLGRVSQKVKIDELDSGPGIEENLAKNNAKWHHNCYTKYSKSKLERARSRTASKEHEPTICTRGSIVPVCTSRDDCTDKKCLICGKGEERGTPLQAVYSFESKEKIEKSAAKKGDSRVLVGLNDWDTPKRVWSHKSCRSNYTYEPKALEDRKSNVAHDDALEFVLKHIYNVKNANLDESPVFRMTDLAQMYSSKLEESGVLTTVNSSRLRAQLMTSWKDLEALGTAGQNVLVTFKKSIDVALRAECKRAAEGVSPSMVKAVEELRDAIFNHTPRDCSELSRESVRKSTPFVLRKFLGLLLDNEYCSTAEEEQEAEMDQAVFTLSQLVVFHTRKSTARGKSKTRRHDVERETPLPIYVACKVYAETRKKELIENLYHMGLSISYDRLQLKLTAQANQACNQYHFDCAVAPLSLEKYRFATGQIDNFDRNPTSMTAKDAFHGTVITLMQHGPPGEQRDIAPAAFCERRKVTELPGDYCVVPVAFVDRKLSTCPTVENSCVPLKDECDPYKEEWEWLENSRASNSCDTWAGHYSKNQQVSTENSTTVGILPPFREAASTVSMMRHGMDVIAKATKLLCPEQTPVVVGDQPLFALCKEIQWAEPEEYGEGKFFIMFGAFQIEQAALRLLGDWLKGSGWTEALVQAGVTSKGRAESMLSVTAACLHSQKLKAYDQYCGDDPLTFEQWCERSSCFPQFKFWDITLRLQLNVLQLVRSLRTGDIELFLQALIRLVPWFFALDHFLYARWLPVHIRDLVSLREKNHPLWREFMAGHFVAQKTHRKFSSMALDQAHEQINALLKGSGGIIGLTEKPSALLKWMLSAPELAETLYNFEKEVLDISEDSDLHHFDSNSARAMFSKDLASLEAFFESSGNPFAEESNDLYNIDTRRCCSEEVKATVFKIEQLGIDQYAEFRNERLESNRVPFHDKIKLNKLPTFSQAAKNSKTTAAKEQVKAIKKDLNLYGQMFVAISNSRPNDLDKFFSHANNAFPPSVASADGKMRSTTKSDLLNKCLNKLVDIVGAAPQVDAKFLDGPAMLYLLNPVQCIFFSDFIENIFIPFINRECLPVSRLDIIFDVYRNDSLKESAWDKRGDGPRVRVSAGTKVPKSWPTFLKNSENKSELFELLAVRLQNHEANGTEIYATAGTGVVTNLERDGLERLEPCNHEEADTRLFVHISDAVCRGHKKVMIRASDTDVVAVAVAFVSKKSDIDELWVHVGHGKQHSYIPAHEIAKTLGPEKSAALPGFHAMTGCDQVSSFHSIGKKSAWNALMLCPGAVHALTQISFGDIDSAIPELEKFVMTMYCPSKSFESLSKCRRALFSSGKPIESIPPTADALKLHIRRASYQAQVWEQLAVQQNLPSPAAWGWTARPTGWEVCWRTLPVMADDCVTITKCKCKVACRGNCKCCSDAVGGCCNLCQCVCNKK